jgi:hypothetical protein
VREAADRVIDLIRTVREEQTSDNIFGGNRTVEQAANSRIYASRIAEAASQIEDALEAYDALASTKAPDAQAQGEG